MKKTISFIAATAMMGTLAIPVSAAETQKKNQSYYNSLSDEEVYTEYKSYCEKIGNTISETEIKDGIIEYDFITISNAQINYNIILPWKFELYMPLWTSESQSQEFEEKSAEYFGFDMIDHGLSFSYYGNNIGTFSGFTSDEKNDIYDCMRNVLTLYNSDFFAEYGKNASINFTLLDGPFIDKKGDTNLDNQVNLADAVMIMQHSANPSAFPITAIGAEFGDMVGDGDGITLLDALAIQKMLLGTD